MLSFCKCVAFLRTADVLKPLNNVETSQVRRGLCAIKENSVSAVGHFMTKNMYTVNKNTFLNHVNLIFYH